MDVLSSVWGHIKMNQPHMKLEYLFENETLDDAIHEEYYFHVRDCAP